MPASSDSELFEAASNGSVWCQVASLIGREHCLCVLLHARAPRLPPPLQQRRS